MLFPLLKTERNMSHPWTKQMYFPIFTAYGEKNSHDLQNIRPLKRTSISLTPYHVVVKNPEWFDVVVTPNMFGDIITDLGA